MCSGLRALGIEILKFFIYKLFQAIDLSTPFLRTSVISVEMTT